MKKIFDDKDDLNKRIRKAKPKELDNSRSSALIAEGLSKASRNVKYFSASKLKVSWLAVPLVFILVFAINGTLGQRSGILNIQSLVLTNNPHQVAENSVMWRQGQVAAEYNYKLLGVESLSHEADKADIYLVVPEKELSSLGLKLAEALGIKNVSMRVDKWDETREVTIYVDPETKAALTVSSNGTWVFNNQNANYKYGSVVHRNHECGSPVFISCSNSWTDILDLPAKEDAFNAALPILRAGGYSGPDSKISTSSETWGVLDGYTDTVSYEHKTCSVYETNIDSCVSTKAEDVANWDYAGFSIRFSSGAEISSARGSFFHLQKIGSTETKSAFDSINFLTQYHQGVGWMSSPVDPPAADKRIDENWTIEASKAGLSLWNGLDNEGKDAMFIVPTFTYKISSNGGDPFPMTFPSVGISKNPKDPNTFRSQYVIPAEKFCAFKFCF